MAHMTTGQKDVDVTARVGMQTGVMAARCYGEPYIRSKSGPGWQGGGSSNGGAWTAQLLVHAPVRPLTGEWKP